MITRAALLLGCLASMIGCAAETAEDGGEAASAVKGADVADASLGRSVVQVYTEQTDERGRSKEKYCTGVLVAPRRVATSLECFSTTRWAWQDGSTYRIAHAVVQTGPALDVVAIVDRPTNVATMSPLFSKEALAPDLTSSQIMERSLAVLSLTADLPGAVPLLTGAVPTDRDEVTIAGYGCDGKSRGSWGTLRSRRMKWNDWKGWFSTSFSCSPGDSGAAVLDGRGRLVGVATGLDVVLPITPDLGKTLARP
jgi:hypothetical protein